MEHYRTPEQYFREELEELSKLPKCDICGDVIQDDHLFDLDGDLICEDCMHMQFRKRTEEYLKGE